uniref:Uncharacterized protein n=1 Tax=Medicago truncatula TaxID=3880 RepID=A2Q2R7_MEDTR|nr:hypothetical protein MtrDRAFT_AC151524g35v2 [Medicago truncatula]
MREPSGTLAIIPLQFLEIYHKFMFQLPLSEINCIRKDDRVINKYNSTGGGIDLNRPR